MVRELIEPIIARESDMEIAGEASADEQLADAVAATKAQVVIVAQRDHELPAVCAELLTERSLLLVLGLSIDRWHGTIHELKPHREPIGEVDPDNLVRAIRRLQEVGS
jgi:hypothetical protein